MKRRYHRRAPELIKLLAERRQAVRDFQGAMHRLRPLHAELGDLKHQIAELETTIKVLETFQPVQRLTKKGRK